ncbi:LOW QUALITY PROTEIN: integrin alpha-4-like [Panulirus ornatus]|uniref:LOW QUALITY PROTEIN: integrin alpha-4-like n=1 Tax=Panulirus ornatus TaxID=150431 RepID=UPI003A8540ED
MAGAAAPVVVTSSAAFLAVAWLAASAEAFNFDPRGSHVLQEPWSAVRKTESYFGYSVALYAARGEALALVGAPRANTTLWSWSSEDIPEPGALYVCPLSDADSTPCRQILVDNSGNNFAGGVASQGYQNMFNHGWLGVTLDLQRAGDTHLVATCGHRWKNQQYSDKYDYFMNGVCYWAFLSDLLSSDFDDSNWQKLLPLLDFDKQRIVDEFTGATYYYYQLGQAGTSAHILNDGSGLLMGTPGVKNWAGTVAMTKAGDTSGNPDSRFQSFFTKSDVMIPGLNSKETDFFGYSVTSGRFWGRQDSLVAGAPRADHSGKVYIFKTQALQMEVEWTGVGGQLGSGYGSAVAAGDIDGDGLSELFVGVPLASLRISSKGGNTEVPEAGEVVVYTPKGDDVSGLATVTVLRGRPSSAGARFGAAVTIIGDVDRDGFQDVAVGAPFEGEGQGAVYIYRGGAGGLVTKASQKILATDFTQPLTGFGVAFSRGVDVDSNGYADLAVGAYSGAGGAVVLRARPAVVVSGSVVSGTAVLTDPERPFDITVCVTYTGYNVQLDVEMELVVRVDEGYADPRAIFLISGSSEFTWKDVAERGKKLCKVHTLQLKEELKDIESPFDLTFYYHSESFDPASPWCKECGVLAPGSTSMARTSVPLALGCGADGICTPTLTLRAEWIEGLSDGRYTVGSGVALTLQVVVRVVGEPAYLGKVLVDLPQGLTAKNLPYSCSLVTSRRLSCALSNSLHQREEVLDLILQEEGQLEEREEIEVQVSAEASGATTQRLETRLLLRRDVQLFLTGYSDNDILHYNTSTLSPQVVSDITIQAENRGVTKVGEVTVEVLVPLAYSPPDGDSNVTFGAITQVSVIPDSGIKSVEVADWRWSKVAPGVVVDGGIETPPTGIPLVATCAVHGMLCGRFFCNLGNVNQEPRISLQTSYNLTYLIEKYGRDSSVAIHTWSTITTPSSADTTPLRAGVWQGIVPDSWIPPSLKPKDAPAWVYIVGVLVGLLILVIIVVIFFKLGFFTRRRPWNEGSPSGERDTQREDAGEGVFETTGEGVDLDYVENGAPEPHDSLLQDVKPPEDPQES